MISAARGEKGRLEKTSPQELNRDRRDGQATFFVRTVKK